MPVGVRTAAGWTMVRGDPAQDGESLVIRTAGEPIDVRLDPFGTTGSWTARDYVFPVEQRDASAYRRIDRP